jgi:hypothetical protein
MTFSQPVVICLVRKERRKMMKQVKAILTLLVITNIIGLGLQGYAQPKIPKEDIPSNIPADVREQIERLYSSDPAERAEGAYNLKEMGARAVPAIPFLIGMLGDDNTVEPPPVAWTLEKIGTSAVAPLIEALKDKNLLVRRWAHGY